MPLSITSFLKKLNLLFKAEVMRIAKIDNALTSISFQQKRFTSLIIPKGEAFLFGLFIINIKSVCSPNNRV